MTVRLAVVVGSWPWQGNGELYGLFQTAPNGAWSSWQSLGKPPGIDLYWPTLSSSQDGRLELFAFGHQHGVGTLAESLWHCWQTAKYGGWHSWVQVPDPAGLTWNESQIVVAPGADGRLELFAANGSERQEPLNQPSNYVWHRWQTTVNGGWSSWQSHGQPPNTSQPPIPWELSLTLAMNADGRLDLFALDHHPDVTNNTDVFQTWHIAQTAPNSGWSSWQNIINFPSTDPYVLRVIGRNADLRLEAFAAGGSVDAAWLTSQSSPNGPWSAWTSQGKPPGRVSFGDFTVVNNADGRLQLFVIAHIDDTLSDIWYVVQTAPNSGWSAWTQFGGPGVGGGGNALAAAQSDDGAIHVFVNANDGNLWHRWQTAPNSGWSAWTNRGCPPGVPSIGWRPATYAS